MGMSNEECMRLSIAGIAEGLEIVQKEREQLQRAFDYVLPFVSVDIRDKALQIAREGASREAPSALQPGCSE